MAENLADVGKAGGDSRDDRRDLLMTHRQLRIAFLLVS
jgi:hypothetical protein